MPKLTALHPVNHDGKDYQEGDTFTVADRAQVAQLVESGAAVVEGGKTKAQLKAEAQAQAELQLEQQAQVAAAEAAAQAEAEAEAQAQTETPSQAKLQSTEG